MLDFPRTLRSAWGAVLVYTLLVILFGAWVRISGSGDGCGQHWPTCQGELVHLPKKLETVVELTHRLTSGLSLVWVLGLGLSTLRRHPRGHLARWAAAWAMAFIIGEALVGAAIVLLRKTGNDTSVARAAIMAVHLLNTAGLTFFILFVARTSNAKEPAWRPGDPGLRRLWVGALLLLLVSAAGAVTALGDTVFPSADHLAIAADAANPSAHFLERVRGFHPLLAVLSAAYLWTTAWSADGPSSARRAVLSILGAQLVLGVLNVLWSAPGYMQILHLGVANLLWLAWIWLILEIARANTRGELRGTSQ